MDCGLYCTAFVGNTLLCEPRGEGFHSSDICVRGYPDPNVPNEVAALILHGRTDPVKAAGSFETDPFSK